MLLITDAPDAYVWPGAEAANAGRRYDGALYGA